MGVATHNIIGRLAASVGALGAVAPQFEAVLDVPHGGVLCALPALLAVGLLDGITDYFPLQSGYYGTDSLLLLLAFMTLSRINSIEGLRDHAPGEWGRLLGLDRVPEVRTLRQKVREMSHAGKPRQWSAALAQRWLAAAPEQANALYIDGHVRVYYGQQTRLPKHYVAREKLCLRATVDYWVNAMDGQPFMVINQVVDPGLIRVIEDDILPRLESMHPALTEPLPTAGRARHRFILVFDREGYSPDFFARLRAKQVACLTYHKYPEAAWSENEFHNQPVPLVSGQIVTMQLAERGVRLSNGLWLREIRKLSQSGHQTAMLTTDYHTSPSVLAAQMFARWSQENFFRYSRQNFALDRLADYSVEEITEPILVVNPAYRHLDSQVRSANGKCSRLLAQLGALNIEQAIEPEQMEPFLAKKIVLHQQIEALKANICQLKAQRKITPRHIKIQDLPENERFHKLANLSKHFLDTIKIIAYRAESAMVNIVREFLPKPDQARAILRALYATEADLLPNYLNKTLTVRLHHSARVHTDEIIAKLCEEINATKTFFPRSGLRLIFKLGSS
jgi:prepilin-type processing-associated H-X9-DG protein